MCTLSYHWLCPNNIYLYSLPHDPQDHLNYHYSSPSPPVSTDGRFSWQQTHGLLLFLFKPFPPWHSTACSLTSVLLQLLARYPVWSDAGSWSFWKGCRSDVGIMYLLCSRRKASCAVSQRKLHSAGSRNCDLSSLSLLWALLFKSHRATLILLHISVETQLYSLRCTALLYWKEAGVSF